MRRIILGTGAVVMVLGLAVGCGQTDSDDNDTAGPDTPSTASAASTPVGPQVRIFALLDRSAIPPAQRREEKVIEITGATALDALVPQRAFPDGELPELPPLHRDERRFAAVTSGCQEQGPPHISGGPDAWQLRFDDDGVRCVAPDYYVVVWDVRD